MFYNYYIFNPSLPSKAVRVRAKRMGSLCRFKPVGLFTGCVILGLSLLFIASVSSPVKWEMMVLVPALWKETTSTVSGT